MNGHEPKPIINCHTHIFIGKNVPPYIGKTFIFWPFYKLLTVPFILGLCRWWFLSEYSPKQWRLQGWFKKLHRAFAGYRSFVRRYVLLDWLVVLVNFIITCHALLFLFQWINGSFIKPDAQIARSISNIINWLKERNLFFDTRSGFIRALVILFTFIFIEYGRKLLLFLLRSLWKFLVFLPDAKTLHFIARYVNIGRFAYYKEQGHIFDKLKAQYPEGTGFVVLPMDMEFMGAGKLKPEGSYERQMKELAILKQRKPETFFPFVFVDSRRQTVGNKSFFEWQPTGNGEVALDSDCFIKEYIEDKGFNGFKIYPALGYYPFDEALLPLWKYAADKQIPILTHCIRGTIFYRGRKKPEWDNHPVFRQAEGDSTMPPLLLPEVANVDFINNFTHPLNYLCLLHERLLRVIVGKAKDQKIKELFGYTDDDTELRHDLSNLKLCFGHYGGDDEWQKFFQNDRDNITGQVITSGKGISFIKDAENLEQIFKRLEVVWKGTDWFSIISSMMLQYDNVYADVSYIIHNDEIIPLLRWVLNRPELNQRVLYGTDFYVVRNHKSEKEMLAHTLANLTTTEFDMIARENPRGFLNL